MLVLPFFTMEAQRVVGELESNSDGVMNPNRMNRGNGQGEDDDEGEGGSKKKKIVPVSVAAWNIDETYGNITPTDVDTISHHFYNSDLPEGVTGHYETLGNLGSPRVSRIFMEREEPNDFIFLTPMDQFFVTTDRFKFFNTKSPYLNATYNFCGSKQTGYDHVKVLFTENVGKLFNFGAIFDYMYGQGYYMNQSTSHMNASVWGSYLGEKYNAHTYYQHNFMKMAENGGIENELYITDPTSISTNQTLSSENIPTRLSSTWNRQENDVFLYNHHYNIGIKREDPNDTTGMKEIFIPVTKFFHTFKLGKYSKNYRSYLKTNDFYANDFVPADTTQDFVKEFIIKNIVGVSLCEGFNKWAAFGINAYVGQEFRNYKMIQAREVNGITTYPFESHKENDFFVGGQLIREMGEKFHFNVNAKFVFAGARLADLDVNGHAEFNFPFLKDTAQVAVNGYIKNLAPDYFMQHYHSRYTWYDEDLSKEWKTRVEGVLTSKRTKTRLTVALENIKNYTYLQDNGNVTSSLEFTQNCTVRQESGMVQVISAQLSQDFAFGIFHLDNEVTYQLSTNKTVLPLPMLNLYHNLYLKFKIAKVLGTEIGADLKYFTSYNAPTYSPSLGMFMNQNPENTVKIGNHPIISAYANLALKKFRFYVQYYHFTQGMKGPFWAPLYPISPTGIHFGVSWNFYD